MLSTQDFLEKFVAQNPRYSLHTLQEKFPQFVSCSSLVVNFLRQYDLYLGGFAGSMYDSVLNLGLETQDLSVWDQKKLPVGSLCWFQTENRLGYKKFHWTTINHVVIGINECIFQCCKSLVGFQNIQTCRRRPVMICNLFTPYNLQRLLSADVAGIVAQNQDRYLQAIE